MRVEFMLAEQGMTSFEVLSRGSCFFVSSSSGGGSPPILLSASHITHPFLWQSRFYPELDWLTYVEERHVKRVLEFRDPVSGELLAESAALGKATPHEELDLVKVEVGEALLAGGAESPFVVPLVGGGDNFAGAQCMVDGYVLGPRPQEERRVWDTQGVQEGEAEDEDAGVLYPEPVLGEVVARGDVRTMVRTETVLEMGACGAPAVFVDQSLGKEAEAGPESLCFGLVEGIVPLLPTGQQQDSPASGFYEKFQGCASVLNHEVLRAFVAR